MKIIILAAGYAVRLQPLTLNTPKPLLTIAGKSLLDRIFDKIGAVSGWDTAYVITNAKFFPNFNDWKKTSIHKDRITVLNDGSTSDENRLGAIRDMEKVITERAITEDVMVVAGDNLFDFSLEDFVEFARSRQDGVSVAIYDVGDKAAARNYGVVALDGSMAVVDFEEKPKDPKSTLASTGIYYFPKIKLPFISEYVKMQNKLDPSTLRHGSGSMVSKAEPSTGSGSTPSVTGNIDHRSRGVDAPGYYIGWLSKADRVYGFKFLGDWYDIGNIESYRKADKIYREKEK